MAQAVAGYWEQFGIKAEIRHTDYAYLRPLFSGALHAPEIVGQASTVCTAGSPVASRDLNTFFCSKGIVKLTDVADAEIQKADSATSMEDLVRYSEAAYHKAYDSFAMSPFFNGDSVYGLSKKVGTIPVTPTFQNIGFWLIQERP